MAENINELLETRNRLTGELRSMLDAWEDKTSNATSEFDRKACGELREKCAKLEVDLDKLEAQIGVASSKARLAKTEARGQEPVIDTRGAMNRGGVDTEKAYAERYARALVNWDVRGIERLKEERATTLTSTSNVGIPTEWQNRIVQKLQQFSVMRSLSTVRTVGADQKIVVENGLPTAYKVAEDSDITESNATFGTQLTVGDYAYGVNMAWSRQYREDAIGGVDYLINKGSIAMGLKLEQEYTTSASAPGGLLSTIAAGQKQAASGSAGTLADITGDDLIDMVHKVTPPYRALPSFRMIFSDTTLKTIRKLKVAASSNEYLWKPSDRFSDIRDGVPGTIYAVPYAVNQYMPAPLTADVGAQPIVVGAFEFFEIYDRGAMEMILDPYTNAQALRTRVIMSLRTDCVNVQPDAFASIVL